MKILYYSDYYTWSNFGTKRSLFLELSTHFEKVIWKDLSSINDVVADYDQIRPDLIILASSGLVINEDEKKHINKNGGKIIGVGMSDPNYFEESRLLSYDAYITNYFETFEKYRSTTPCFYNKTGCDFRFHKRPFFFPIKKYFASFIGLAVHPWLKNKDERKEIVQKIRNSGVDIFTFGNGWGKDKYNHPNIEGIDFRKVLQQSNIGIDIQDENSPIAHRTFEYSACGTPVITRKRPEVEKCFLENEEILFYSSLEELVDKINFYKKNKEILKKIGINAYNRCIREHDIKARVKEMTPFFETVLNET